MAKRLIVPEDRTFERTQGCWNCKHSSRAAAFWTQRRQQDLARALTIAQEHPAQGEEHTQVVNIRRMVDTIDNQVAAGTLLRCGGDGKTAAGDPVADLVAHNFLCHKWSGAQGASIARAGQRADDLPEELADKIDGQPQKAADDFSSMIASHKGLIQENN